MGYAIGSLPKGIQALVKGINKKFGKGSIKTADEIDQPEKTIRQQIMEFEARNKPDAITMESREILDVPPVPEGFKLSKEKLMAKFPEIDEDFADQMMDMDKDTAGRIIKMLENRRLDPEAYDRLLEKYGDTLEFQAEFDKVVRRKNNNQGGLNYLMGM
jgi:predicted ATP-dependent endonuclease of OLD family